MAINFPDPAAQSPVNVFSPASTPMSTSNGMTYAWTNGSWTIKQSASDDALLPDLDGGPHQPGTTDDRYIEVSGDNMTGALTIGPVGGPAVTTLAFGSPSEFSNDIQVGVFDGGASQLFSTSGTKIGADATLLLRKPENSTEEALLIDAGPDNAVTLSADGSGQFTGDVTTPNSALKANGVVQADVRVEVGGNPGSAANVGMHIRNDGMVLTTAAANSGLFTGYAVGDAQRKVFFSSAGNAEFAGYVDCARLNASNEVKVGEFDVSNADSSGIAANEAGYISVKTPGSSTTSSIIVRKGVTRSFQAVADGTLQIGGTLDANPFNSAPNIALNADGTASFAGNVGVNGPTNFTWAGLSVTDGLAVVNDYDVKPSRISFANTGAVSTAAIESAGDNTAGYLSFITRKSGSDVEQLNINADGLAHFSGNVTSDGSIGFNLEPDNPANYTTTTEEYTETETYTGPLGNTLEREVTKTRDIQTYTGPTLDVKDRLQNLIARIDAIEANEVIDDATDSTLLLAVQALTQRLDERDATIADLQARITTLEA